MGLGAAALCPHRRLSPLYQRRHPAEITPPRAPRLTTHPRAASTHGAGRPRDFPQDSARLELRLAALTQDIKTVAWAAAPLTMGTRTCTREQALAPLTDRLRTLPTRLFETRAVPLGVVQALHAAHTLDASPASPAARATTTVAEAITTRLRQQTSATPAPEDVRLPEALPPLVLVPTPAPARHPTPTSTRRRATPRQERSAPPQLRLW